MKLLKRILVIAFIGIMVGIVIVWDIADRGQYYSKHTPDEEFKEFFLHKTSEQQQKAFKKYFGYGKYQFPRVQTAQIKLFRNTSLISRLSSRTLNDLNRSRIISFFNNPNNFDWSETTWGINESEYILRFYDDESNEIGKIWLCLEGCFMTESVPFSPNMKYGGLSTPGRSKLQSIIDQILDQ